MGEPAVSAGLGEAERVVHEPVVAAEVIGVRHDALGGLQGVGQGTRRIGMREDDHWDACRSMPPRGSPV